MSIDTTSGASRLCPDHKRVESNNMAAAPSPFASVRLADVPTGPITRNPIPGLRAIPRVSVEAAMEFAVSEDREWADAMPDLRENLRHAQAFATNFLNRAPPGEPLNREEIIGLRMYTMDSPFFRILNTRLRSENRDLLRPYLRLLKILIGALYRLPQQRGLYYRGVQGDLRDNLRNGHLITWWSFSSTTYDQNVVLQETFAGVTGPRTIFNINACAVFDVSRYSALPESERLLAPGAILKVRGVAEPVPGSGLYQITLDQEPFQTLPIDGEVCMCV
jgi:hypothetical protein